MHSLERGLAGPVSDSNWSAESAGVNLSKHIARRMEQTSAEETTLNPTCDWRLQGLVVQVKLPLASLKS
jgi:hypothetical protein